MSDTLQVERTETVAVPIRWVGWRCGQKCARVMIDGESMELRIPKGTRGVKVGALLRVRVEWRAWYTITRTTINMREGTSETVEERGEYRDGALHAHPFVEGVE